MSTLADTTADQLEGLGESLDESLASLELLLPGGFTWPLLPSLTGGELERTIEGASTLTLNVDDHERMLWGSGVLGAGVEVELDGLRFRLVRVAKTGDDLALTFEDREVALLRAYPRDESRRHGWRAWPADKVTREQVAAELVAEVKESPLVLVTPAGPVPAFTRAVAKKAADKIARGPGFAPGAKLSVKRATATPEQRENLRRVLDVGNGMFSLLNPHRRKLLVVAVMVVIQESTARNLPGGDADSVGLFQQRKTGGRPDGKGRWPASRDIEKDATAFFEVADYEDRLHPDALYGWLASEIQRDGTWGGPEQGRYYAQWGDEAERWVDAYGVHGGDAQDPKSAAAQNNQAYLPDDAAIDKANQFIRGKVETKHGRKFFVRESNWDCLGRLADEVNWRRFVVSGLVYFMDDPSLFASAPRMSVRESDPGVSVIDGDYDVGKRNATVTVDCRIGLWQAPPGSVVEVAEGRFAGRWLVTSVGRPLFDSAGEVTLKKPRPMLPESEAPEHASDDEGAVTLAPTRPKGKRKKVDPRGRTAGGYVAPLPTPMGASDFNNGDGCEGVPGAPPNIGWYCKRKNTYCIHGAHDWFASPGSDVAAPIAGTIVERKLATTHSGQVFGGVAKLEEDGGRVWVFRHVEPVFERGVRVEAGDVIGRVSQWTDNPRGTHTHIEVWKSLAGGYTYSNVVDPVTLFAGGS